MPLVDDNNEKDTRSQRYHFDVIMRSAGADEERTSSTTSSPSTTMAAQIDVE